MDSSRPDIVDEHGMPLRRLRRPDQLRALAHPRRMELIDLLVAEGPLTASECADRLHDSAASCSYHLRQLARFGFVEEAEGGRGRNRPWRWVPVGNRIETDPDAGPAEQSARESVESVLDARAADRIQAWRNRRSSDPWRGSADASDYTLRITQDELTDLRERISALLMPLQRRTFEGDQPDGTRIVDVFTYLLPRPERRAGRSAGGDDSGA